uniref:Non-structural polyprotein p200 n=1 Tax=Rubella virus (strain BRDII) TaxID=376263 RepID=POLN_RUBVC|nr:RecName: Full=Non-structural polyprotein p200; Short=p200; Contains: RecName: Full=Protease/methyltransferase p150; Short=p150; Contains: RecName: Full=RNA-directed RNA polymerase p90; Short=p90 [Rubella virus strain BRDII]AAP82234.1 nonstructural polyprotein precursor [Rubella virus]
MEKLLDEVLAPGGPYNLTVGSWVRDHVRSIVEGAWEVRDVVTAAQKRAIVAVIPRPVFTQMQVSDHPALHAISRYTRRHWIEWGPKEALHVLIDPSPGLLREVARVERRWVALCLHRTARKLATALAETAGEAWHADYVCALRGAPSGPFYVHPEDVPRGGRAVADRCLLYYTPMQMCELMRTIDATLLVAVDLWPVALAAHVGDDWDDLGIAWHLDHDGGCPADCRGAGAGPMPGYTRPCTTRIYQVLPDTAHPGRLYRCGPRLWTRDCAVAELSWEVAQHCGHQARVRAVRCTLPIRHVRSLQPSARVRLPDLVHLAEVGRWRWFSLPRPVFQRMLSYCKTLSPDAYYSERVFKFKNALSHSITLAGNVLQEGWKGTCAEEDALCAYVAFRAWQSNARLAGVMKGAKRCAADSLSVAGWLGTVWDAIKRFFGSVPLAERMEEWEQDAAVAAFDRGPLEDGGHHLDTVQPPKPLPRPEIAATWIVHAASADRHCACAPRCDVPRERPSAPAGPPDDEAIIPPWLFAECRTLRCREWDFEALRARADTAATPAPLAPRPARHPTVLYRHPAHHGPWLTLDEPGEADAALVLCDPLGQPLRGPERHFAVGAHMCAQARGLQAFVRVVPPPERPWADGGARTWAKFFRGCAWAQRLLGEPAVMHLPYTDGDVPQLIALALRTLAQQGAALALSVRDLPGGAAFDANAVTAAVRADPGQLALTSPPPDNPPPPRRARRSQRHADARGPPPPAPARDPPPPAPSPPAPPRAGDPASPISAEPADRARDAEPEVACEPGGPATPARADPDSDIVESYARAAGPVHLRVRNIMDPPPGCKVVVNAANEGLLAGSGVCGAIFASAAASLAEDCRRLAPCPTGEAVATPGHGCGYAHIIHAVAPRRPQDPAALEQSEALLERAYRSIVALAAARRWTCVACPLLGAGIYGWSAAESLRAALAAARTEPAERVSLHICHPDRATLMHASVLVGAGLAARRVSPPPTEPPASRPADDPGRSAQRTAPPPAAPPGDAAAPELRGCQGCELCRYTRVTNDRAYVNLWLERDRGATGWAMRIPEVVVYGPEHLAAHFPLNHYSVLKPAEVRPPRGMCGSDMWRCRGWQGMPQVRCTPSNAHAALCRIGIPPRVSTRGDERDPNTCWLRAAANVAQAARACGAYTSAGCPKCAYGRALSEARTHEDFAALSQRWIASHADASLDGTGDPLDPLMATVGCACSRVWVGSEHEAPPDHLLVSLHRAPNGPWGVVLEVRARPEGGNPTGHFVCAVGGGPRRVSDRPHLWLAVPLSRGGGTCAATDEGLAQAYYDDLEVRRLGDDAMARAALASVQRPRKGPYNIKVWNMAAGAGKTTRILAAFTREDLYVCPTNALLHEIQAKLRARDIDIKNAATYERALTKPLAAYRRIYIDEAFTLGGEYCAFVASQTTAEVICVGDRDQCGPHYANNCRTPVPDRWPTERSRHTWRFPDCWAARLRAGLDYDVEGEHAGTFACNLWDGRQVDLHLAFSRETVRRLHEAGIRAYTVREAQGMSVGTACIHVGRDGTDVALALTRDLAIVSLTRASDALYLHELEDGSLRAAGLSAFLDAGALAELKEVPAGIDRVVAVEQAPPPLPPADGIPEAQDVPPFCPRTLEELVFGRAGHPHYADLNRVTEGEREVRYMRISRHLLNKNHTEMPGTERVLSAVCAVRRYRAGEDGSTLRTAVARQHPRPFRQIPPPRVTAGVAQEWRMTYLRERIDLTDVYTQMGVAARELTDRYARRYPEIFAGMCTAQSLSVPAFLKATLKCVDAALGPRDTEDCHAAQGKAGLEIRAWAKEWVQVMSPHFRAIQKIIMRALRPQFLVAAGHTEPEVDAWWQAHYTTNAIEVDFTEFDMNQTLATRDVELEISAALLGLPCAEDYRALRAGSYCTLRELGSTETGCERTSGEPATLLHNTTVAMCMAMRMVPKGVRWAGIFQGDDMVIFLPEGARSAALKWTPSEVGLFGSHIPVKHVSTPTPSFCGHVGTAAGLFHDVMHQAIKVLCRRFDPDVLEEQQVALLDRLRGVYAALPDTVAANAAYYDYSAERVLAIVRELTAYARGRGLDHPATIGALEEIQTPYARANLHDAD